MKTQKMPKPRNPFVQHLIKRKSGVHQKPYKTARRDAKVELKKDYSDKAMFSLSSLEPVAELV
jgi:hypothetical protein